MVSALLECIKIRNICAAFAFYQPRMHANSKCTRATLDPSQLTSGNMGHACKFEMYTWVIWEFFAQCTRQVINVKLVRDAALPPTLSLNLRKHCFQTMNPLSSLKNPSSNISCSRPSPLPSHPRPTLTPHFRRQLWQRQKLSCTYSNRYSGFTALQSYTTCSGWSSCPNTPFSSFSFFVRPRTESKPAGGRVM